MESSPTINGKHTHRGSPPQTFDASNLPCGEKSLSGIAVRAHLLGLVLGISVCTALVLFVVLDSPLWRIPFFLASLCLFHFLEFYTTARYNTPQATISAFLLSANGWAYNAAHGSAIVECLVSHYLYPSKQPGSGRVQLVVGIVWMAVGQGVRSLAMVQAASNFNHNVQIERKEGHVLVQHGIYGVLRHPSYFGFFWWGLGTQLVLGNVVCLVGYAVVLWRFFCRRINSKFPGSYCPGFLLTIPQGKRSFWSVSSAMSTSSTGSVLGWESLSSSFLVLDTSNTSKMDGSNKALLLYHAKLCNVYISERQMP